MNMYTLNLFVILSFVAFTSVGSELQPKTVLNLIPEAKLVGKGRFEYLFWDIYDAYLYAPNGEFDDDKPFALTLSYLRDVEGREIAKRSVKEMSEQKLCESNKFADWEDRMATIFPDISEGQAITGVRDKNQSARFYLDGEVIGVITEAEFTRCFFAIWLSERTSEPELRKKLLGTTDE